MCSVPLYALCHQPPLCAMWHFVPFVIMCSQLPLRAFTCNHVPCMSHHVPSVANMCPVPSCAVSYHYVLIRHPIPDTRYQIDHTTHLALPGAGFIPGSPCRGGHTFEQTRALVIQGTYTASYKTCAVWGGGAADDRLCLYMHMVVVWYAD